MVTQHKTTSGRSDGLSLTAGVNLRCTITPYLDDQDSSWHQVRLVTTDGEIVRSVTALSSTEACRTAIEWLQEFRQTLAGELGGFAASVQHELAQSFAHASTEANGFAQRSPRASLPNFLYDQCGLPN
jgi:hypothetical protein